MAARSVSSIKYFQLANSDVLIIMKSISSTLIISTLLVNGIYNFSLCVVGVICAAPIGEDWYRAQVVQTYPDCDEYDVKLVDYGGYIHVLGSSLRQIR